MSTDKNPEAVSCDASIMKNVWEIRCRDYEQKQIVEKGRIGKSALPSINKEWAARLSSRNGGFKRAEKPRQRVEINAEDIWKSKEPMNPPRGAGPGPLGRPAGQSRNFSMSTSSKERKVQEDKNFKRLHLLMYIAQSQPSAMVWGKSWKYNKGLPSPAEGSTAGWGHCWMYAILQPNSENGKPWPNGPNKMNPHSLHLWSKTGYRMVESLQLDLILPSDEWQTSWKRHSKDSSKQRSENKEDFAKFGFFTTLVESQWHNETRSSSEWSDSWRATKPGDGLIVSEDVSMNESHVSEHGRNDEINSKWEECWRFVNFGRNTKPKLVKQAPQEWINSWRVAVAGFNKHDKSVGHDLSHTTNNHGKKKESDFFKIMALSHEPKHKHRFLQLCNEIQVLPEWNKSWQVAKNNSEPCEEIKKILKKSPPIMETAVRAQSMNNKERTHSFQPEEVNPFYQLLKHDVWYQPKKKFTENGLSLLKALEKKLNFSEWRESWKVTKHRKRMERRRMRSNPLQTLREDMKPPASEWKDSWKSSRHSLHQEPDMWQQDWQTAAPLRVNRATAHNHFPTVEQPKNGPSGQPGWNESWRSFRRQPGSQSERAQAPQTAAERSVHHPDNSWQQGSSDWQLAWMISENHFHHDNPSLTQWREAWKCSTKHTHHWSAQQARDSWVDANMELQPPKVRGSLPGLIAKMSRSFDNQVFRDRYPEKEWKPSWNAASILSHQRNYYGSSTSTNQQSNNNLLQQSADATQNDTRWGKSFRLANPMPQTEQHWVELSPNPSCYTVVWRKGKKMPVKVSVNFINSPVTFKVWKNSCRLLQGESAQKNNKSKSQHTDPQVIMTNMVKAKNHFFTTIDNEKWSDRKWAGCHLLGKTQPRPKKNIGPNKMMKPQDNKDEKFLEEWAGSWTFLVSSASLKKQKPFKSLSGWSESWKFLFPQYPPMNGPKIR